MLRHAVTATLVYFQQANITRAAITDRAARTAFFAQLDVWVNVLTIVVQIFLTGRILKWLGVGLTLAMLPAISLVGFLAIGFMPGLGLLALFQVLRRAMNCALSRPAREVLFTVLRREDKYKAKSFTRRSGVLMSWAGVFMDVSFTWYGLTCITGLRRGRSSQDKTSAPDSDLFDEEISLLAGHSCQASNFAGPVSELRSILYLPKNS